MLCPLRHWYFVYKVRIPYNETKKKNCNSIQKPPDIEVNSLISQVAFVILLLPIFPITKKKKPNPTMECWGHGL